MEKLKLSNIIPGIEAPLMLFLFLGLFIDSLTSLALVASVALFIFGIIGIVYCLMHKDGRLPAYMCIFGTDLILGLAVLFFKFIL